MKCILGCKVESPLLAIVGGTFIGSDMRYSVPRSCFHSSWVADFRDMVLVTFCSFHAKAKSVPFMAATPIFSSRVIQLSGCVLYKKRSVAPFSYPLENALSNPSWYPGF